MSLKGASVPTRQKSSTIDVYFSIKYVGARAMGSGVLFTECAGLPARPFSRAVVCRVFVLMCALAGRMLDVGCCALGRAGGCVFGIVRGETGWRQQ